MGRPLHSRFYQLWYNSVVSIGYRITSCLFHAQQSILSTVGCAVQFVPCPLCESLGFRSVWEGVESIVSTTAPLSACSRSLFLFPCENQPQLYQFLLFFQYFGYSNTWVNYDYTYTKYLLHRTLDNTPIYVLNNGIWLSEEQVPSAPFELLNGKPKLTSFTLGVKNTWYPIE